MSTIPDDLVNALMETSLNVSDPTSWALVFFASHMYAFGESVLVHVREAVRGMGNIVDDGDTQSLLHSLEIASVVVKTNRDTSVLAHLNIRY